MITFGRAYGNIQAYDFLPSRDYVYIDETAFTGSNTAGPLQKVPNTTNSTVTSPSSNSTEPYSNSSIITLRQKRADTFTYEYSIKVWENVGTGGGKLKGDGDRYCNMMGRANGRQDYVWIWSNGKMWIWEALDSFPSQPKYWGNDYLLWDITAERSMDRRDITLAEYALPFAFSSLEPPPPSLSS